MYASDKGAALGTNLPLGVILKRLILAALVCGAAFVFPAAAMADPPICHDGILSDDAGQNCADGLYNQVYGSGGSGGSNWAICHDGILSDDVGQGCTNDGGAAYTYHSSPTYSSTPVASSGGGYGDVPGVPSGFASCVAMRESTNGAGSSNIYGILPSNGYYPGMSVGAQKQLFAQMYGRSGSAPWSPYDGC